MPVDSPAAWPALLRPATAITGLALLWLVESRTPAASRPGALQNTSRLRHAARNYGLAAACGLTVLWAAGGLIIATTEYAEHHSIGLLRSLPLHTAASTALAILLLDLWTWAWHLACHRIPLLWRFHRVHHSDTAMDVSTSARFHPGELACSTAARIPVILLLGVSTAQLLLFETLLLAVSQLHHSAITARHLDRWLGWLLVTPGIHRVHHSRNRDETNSNYSAILSVWDRLFRTRCSVDGALMEPPGLSGMDGDDFQTLLGLLKTPLISPHDSPKHPASAPQTSALHPPSPENQTAPISEP